MCVCEYIYADLRRYIHMCVCVCVCVSLLNAKALKIN